jgi:hypothetical protein
MSDNWVRYGNVFDASLPQCKMSLLMWWTVPAPSNEVP